MGSNKMKLLIAGLLCATVVLALPEGRRLRPEEHWRPAQGRDLSKYKPRQAMLPITEQDLAWAVKEVKKNGASTNKGTKLDLKATCGIEGPPAGDRIVGGIEAEENQWPWQVALFIDDAWFCGGSLISENYVMAGAHCVDGASYFDVMAGAHNVRDASEPHRVEGDLVTVTGWGKPSDSAGGISPVLRMVSDLPVITNSDCNDVYGIVGSGVVCIDTTGGKGSCNGYSGGPLVTKAGMTKAGQAWNQVGIVSFGSSSGCETGLPAGFTRVEYYLDWIKSETGM